MGKHGALPSQMLRQMTRGAFARGIDPKNIRPASIDLALTGEIYRVPGTFLILPGEKVRDYLDHIGAREHDLSQPLERDVTCVARLEGTIELPLEVYGYANPKSTTGRTDCHVRMLADGVSQFDQMTPAGWRGQHWLSIVPKSFPIALRAGLTLAQLRLFNADTRLDQLQLELAVNEWQLLWTREGEPVAYSEHPAKARDGSLLLTADFESKPMGWECLRPNAVFDFAAPAGSYDPAEFFRPIEARNGSIVLRRGRFYILSTHQAIRVPPQMACEMRPMDERFGDLRAHYAGYIDTGWGWGEGGEGRGRPITLEVRPFEDFIIRRGQVVARVKFEMMIEPPPPEDWYDVMQPSYGVQSGPRLAKQFRST